MPMSFTQIEFLSRYYLICLYSVFSNQFFFLFFKICTYVLISMEVQRLGLGTFTVMTLVQPLVRELRCCKPCLAAKNK